MGFEEIWNEYTSSEKDMFQKSVRRLLKQTFIVRDRDCLLYTSPSPRDRSVSRMPSSA